MNVQGSSGLDCDCSDLHLPPVFPHRTETRKVISSFLTRPLVSFDKRTTDLQSRYLFATLLLAAHFIVALAQTAKTAIEGILNFGPVVLPVSAYLVSLLFRKRPRARTGHVEDGHDATDHQGPALSTGVSSTNDLRLQHLPPRVEPPIEPSSAAGAEAGEDDIGVQAIGALLSASFGS